MNPRTQNILLVVLGGLLVLALGGIYAQHVMLRTQKSSLESIQQQLQGIQKGSSTVPVVLTPPTQVTATTSVPAAPTSQLPIDGDLTAPIWSPDGQWQVVYRKTGEDSVVDTQTDQIMHTLEVRSRDGKTVRELLQVTEAVSKNQDSPGTNTWVSLGWNALGTKVYVAVTPIIGGLGGNYPDADPGAKSLIEVDVQTGQQKVLLDLGMLWNVQNGIYLNTVQLQKNLFTYSTLQYNEEISQSILYLSSLDLKNRQAVMTLRSGGIAHVEFNEDNTKLRIRTYEGELVNDGYVYKNWEYTIATRALVETTVR